jgi:hypothetical protein
MPYLPDVPPRSDLESEPERRGRPLADTARAQDGRGGRGELAEAEGRREGGDSPTRACGEDVAVGDSTGGDGVYEREQPGHMATEFGRGGAGEGTGKKMADSDGAGCGASGIGESEHGDVEPFGVVAECPSAGAGGLSAGRREEGRNPPGHVDGGDPAVANGESIRRGEGRSESEGEQGRPDAMLRGELGDPDRAGLPERGQAGGPEGEERDAEAHADAERSGGTGAPVEPGLGGASHGLASWLDAFAASGRPPVAGRGPEQFPWEPPRTCKGFKDRSQRIRAIGNGQDPWALALAWEILSEKVRGVTL